MSDSVLIALIVTAGASVAAITWKLLDIGKRAVELERDRSPRDTDDATHRRA